MDRLSVMQLFLRVSATGSFSKAARELGISQPTASKQIAALEARIGAQLLRRTSRGLSLTAAGTEYHETAERLLADLEATEARIGCGRVCPAGRVRVAMPSAFGRLYVVPRLPELTRQYPNVTFDVDISDRYVNLVEEGIDVAIRFGKLSDSSLLARRIGSKRLVTVATPTYLEAHGEPRGPGDLASHRGIVIGSNGAALPWCYGTSPEALTVVPKEVFRSNDAELLRGATLSGAGIAQAASWLFAEDLVSGALKTILGGFEPPLLPISAVWASGRMLPARVQVFVDFLARLCAEENTLRIAGDEAGERSAKLASSTPLRKVGAPVDGAKARAA